MENGAPAEVGRNILKRLLDHSEILPFAEIKLFCKEKNVHEIRNSFDLDVITYKNLNKITKHDLVHIPVLPTILPNAKFLLYLYIKVIKRGKLILQYHGDVRKELKSSYKDIISLIHILTYIFVPQILRSSDRVITHSYYMNEIITKYGAKKLVVIPNAIDEYWYQKEAETEAKSSRVIDHNNFNIFYHGRLSWEKGVDVLIEAFGHYAINNPNTTIYLAGEGPQKKQLKDLCSNLDIDKRVIFLGNINKEEIVFFLKNVDVAIYPSRFDNFPLAVLEALACANCPVYFSKNIGIYDFVIQDGFKLNSFELDVENLIKVLDSASCSTNKNVVNQQIQFAINYTWDRVILKYIELYHDVIN
ncbi:MAG: glycosyltransferase family 4 protein [Methanosarcina sp.]|uniref:glycosyltransferase family 4 protein n=1 Tax=Methanosarcina sp. TaxID=2213 RepID=UPI00261F9FA3|nr:glycosyltransferase family 4 protein [Methanosarcina sp.]MDD3245962.1 glycosyltransferase family 4 protein [Methanosarcina sp.]